MGNCFFDENGGIWIENSKVKIDRNMFSAGHFGVMVFRKSKSTSIVSNVFNGSSIKMVNGAQPLIQSNKFHLSDILVTSSTPNIVNNIFTGENLMGDDQRAHYD